MIVGVIGKRGSGKTLTMVKQIMDDLNKGKNIFLNFHLKLKHINKKYHKKIHLLDDEFFKDYENFKLRNCSLFLDEIYVYIDSRTSGSKRNRIWSYFINQTRKRDISLYYTVQLFSSVEKRLRLQTELFIFPSIKENNKEKFIVNTIAIPQDFSEMPKIKGKFIFKGNDYYKFYSTDEIVSFKDT